MLVDLTIIVHGGPESVTREVDDVLVAIAPDRGDVLKLADDRLADLGPIHVLGRTVRAMSVELRCEAWPVGEEEKPVEPSATKPRRAKR